MAKHQRIEGDHLGFFLRKTSHNAKKTERDPLVSPGIVCYAEKGNTFLVQFARPNDSIWNHKIS